MTETADNELSQDHAAQFSRYVLVRPTNRAFVTAVGVAAFLGSFLIRDQDGVALSQKLIERVPVTGNNPSYLPGVSERELRNAFDALSQAIFAGVSAYMIDRGAAGLKAKSAQELYNQVVEGDHSRSR